MADISYRAFLSCSFDEEEETLVDFFKKMISSFDITPVVYDYQEIGGLSEKIKGKISECDCLIAIITRKNKLEGSEEWSCPAWVQHEVSLAHAYSKPIALFVEKGVLIEGMIEKEERWVWFGRENLLADVNKISSFLYKLRKHLETSAQNGTANTRYLLRHYARSREEIQSRDWSVEKTEICIESLIDGLTTAFHKMEREEQTEDLVVKPEEFSFKCLDKPSRTTVEHEVLVNTDDIFSWQATFDPPLKKGEKVTYAYKKRVPRYNPYTYEELMQRIEAGTYEYKEPKCEACEWLIAHPTVELQHISEFPENYEIKDIYPDVVYGREKVRAEKELERIIDEGMFTAEKVFDKWILTLSVKKPLLNHKYFVYYVPPREDELV